MICQKCGTEIPEGSLFCDKCGAPVEPEAQPEIVPAAPAPKKKKKTGCIIGAVIGAVLLGLPTVVILVVLLLGLIVGGTLMVPWFNIQMPVVKVPVAQTPTESIVSTMPTETVPETLTEETLPEQEAVQQVYLLNGGCYHIPVVELPGVDTTGINRQLYDTYYGVLEQNVFIDREPDIMLGQMTYSVGRRGDIVSVVVRLGWDYDMDEYVVHNYSISTGAEVSWKELIRSYNGMGETYFRGIAKLALEKYFDNLQAEREQYGFTEDDKAFFQEVKERTLENSNIYRIVPMVAENGELQFIGEIYSMAGADSYFHRFDQKGNLIDMFCEQHS